MTSATAQARPEPGNGFSKARQAFRNWRRTRPFWGGLLVLLAGLPILYFPYASMSVGGLRIQLATTAGAGALVIGLLLIALGISVWFQPLVRVFTGIAAIVLALVSLPMANFGGFGLGLVPGLIGGALLCSWAPLKAGETVESFEEQAEAQAAALQRTQERPEAEGPTSKLTELMTDGDDTIGGEGKTDGE